jgi:hypothetical protein
MTRWHAFDMLVDSLDLPIRPACYAIYLNGSLRYIGQTANLRKRIAGHGIELARYSDSIMTKEWGQFKACTIKANFGVRYGDWAMRELRLIRRLQPDLNCVGSIRRRAAA